MLTLGASFRMPPGNRLQDCFVSLLSVASANQMLKVDGLRLVLTSSRPLPPPSVFVSRIDCRIRQAHPQPAAQRLLQVPRPQREGARAAPHAQQVMRCPKGVRVALEVTIKYARVMVHAEWYG